jgi:hypothetical protein
MYGSPADGHQFSLPNLIALWFGKSGHLLCALKSRFHKMRSAFHNSPCHMADGFKKESSGSEPDVSRFADKALEAKNRSKKGKASLHLVRVSQCRLFLEVPPETKRSAKCLADDLTNCIFLSPHVDVNTSSY